MSYLSPKARFISALLKMLEPWRGAHGYRLPILTIAFKSDFMLRQRLLGTLGYGRQYYLSEPLSGHNRF